MFALTHTPVTEAVWLAGVAAGPGFVEAAGTALQTWRVERWKKEKFLKKPRGNKSMLFPSHYQWWRSRTEHYFNIALIWIRKTVSGSTPMGTPGLLWWTDQYINRPSCTEKKKKSTAGTWDAAVVGWEVGVAVGVGRLWRTSSGGGTGKTTGAALDGSLLTSKTSMGPVELLRRIWYFLWPLRIWKTHIRSLRHETQQQPVQRSAGKEKYDTCSLQIRVWGPLAVCHLERGLLEVCPLWRKDRHVSEWWKLCLGLRQAVEWNNYLWMLHRGLRVLHRP